MFRCPVCHHTNPASRYAPYYASPRFFYHKFSLTRNLQGLYRPPGDQPYFQKPVDFKGPLYNGQSAVVNTAPLAVLSFCLSSQVPYSPAAAQLHHTLSPYFVRSSSELEPEDDDDNSDNDDNESSHPKVEAGCLESGPDTDGEDPLSDCSEAERAIKVPDDRYTYQTLEFNLGDERLRRSYRKRLAKVRDLMVK